MHNGAVLFAAFGPEGRRVVTTCADGTTRVWDTRAGDPLTPPLRVGAAVRDVNLDESGTVLVLTDANSAKQTWDLRPTKASVDDLLRLTRCLAGGRIDPHLGFIPLQPAEMLEAARSHGGTYPDDIDR
jgi:WD40 repeat protein